MCLCVLMLGCCCVAAVAVVLLLFAGCLLLLLGFTIFLFLLVPVVCWASCLLFLFFVEL